MKPKRSRHRLGVYVLFAAGGLSSAAAGLTLFLPLLLPQHERTAFAPLQAPVAAASATAAIPRVRSAAPARNVILPVPPSQNAFKAVAQSGPGREPAKHRISSDLLARLIGSCAAQINPRTQAAIVAVESGGDAWAMLDDNDRRHYSPDSYEDAVAIERVLHESDRRAYGAADRGIDVGLAQINSNNFANLRVDAAKMFDPCDNLRASARIFAAAYSHERALLGTVSGAGGDQLALQRALQVYNSGKGSGDESYVRAILATLETPFVRTVALGAPNASASETNAQQSPTTDFAAASDDQRVSDTAPITAAAKRGETPAGQERSAVFVHVDATATAAVSDRAPVDRARE